MLAVSQKSGYCRKYWPGCTWTLKPDQKLHCLFQNAFCKRQHDQTAQYSSWSECLHCLRFRVECTNSGDWSAYTSVTCDQLNASQIILKKKSNKNAANKIHLVHVNASMAKIEMRYSLTKCSKMLHNVYISGCEINTGNSWVRAK